MQLTRNNIKVNHIPIEINTDKFFNKQRNGNIIITCDSYGKVQGYYYCKINNCTIEVYHCGNDKDRVIKEVRKQIKDSTINILEKYVLSVDAYSILKQQFINIKNKFNIIKTNEENNKSFYNDANDLLEELIVCYKNYLLNGNNSKLIEKIKSYLIYNWLRFKINSLLGNV